MAKVKVKAKVKAKTKVKTKIKAKAKAPVRAKKSSAPPKTLNLAPVRNRVIIRREQSLQKTAGGLYIPDTAQDKPLTGKVIAVGSGSINKKGQVRPMAVHVGDRVLYGSYAGSQVQINGEELLVVEETDILGILQD